MLYKTLSAAVYGIDANIIQVEVDCSGIKCDQDHFHTVGLPDAAVRESRDRVRAAIRNAGFEFPVDRITVNLGPAELRKEGAVFDLPMALGILSATGLVKPGRLEETVVLGELRRLESDLASLASADPDSQQLRVRTVLDDPTAIEHQDTVKVRNSGQPVCHDQHQQATGDHKLGD